jgi:polysaccharide biosynthesis protein PslF
VKALIISAAFPPLRTGGADFVHRLASELASRQVEVIVVASDHAESADDRIRLHRIGTKWNWRAAQECMALVEKNKPDIVDIIFTGWMYRDHPMITFLPTLIKRRYPDIRVVLHIESLGGIQRSRSNIVRAATRYFASMVAGRENISFEYGAMLRDSDAIITLSDRDRDELCKRDPQVGPKSVTIPPPPIMPVTAPLKDEARAAARRRLGFGNKDLVLSFYGYVYPGKGLEVLFEAIKFLLLKKVFVRLLIVGDTPERYVLEREGRPNYLTDLKTLARQLEISDRIGWMDYAPYGSSEPSMKLRLSDICVFPFMNGINLHNSSFWFAAAHGLPIVATRSQSTETVFVDHENIVFAKSGDADDLAVQILRLSKDEELKRKIGSNAEELAVKTFSWASCVTHTIEVYSG